MSLDTLRDKTLDLTPYASEERYRFIDCNAFINNRTLEIWETASLSSLPGSYSTVSYVWFGLTASPSELRDNGSFHVYCGERSDGTPREDGGPIGMQVLDFACQYCSKYHAPYLWLDRLCIMQTSKRDKSWQISRMYDIYADSQECVVLPGGLQRLASVFEETNWAERAWTYQEAVVTWEFAVVLTRDWYRPKGEQHWLVEGECHWQYLQELFLAGSDLLSPQLIEDSVPDMEALDIGWPKACLILGNNKAALDTLKRIMEYKAYNHSLDESEEAVDEDQERVGENTIRQIVLLGVAMRVSSRPVDMVFGVAGLVGVQGSFGLRAGDFGENERFYATLALVEAMLRDDPDTIDGLGDNMLVDVPLWGSLELLDISPNREDSDPASRLLDVANYPSLQELAEVFEAFDRTSAPAENAKLRLLPLSRLEHTFKVAQAEDDPVERATDIARTIPKEDLLSAYHGDAGRHILRHEDEGIIELCRTLDIKDQLSLEEELDSLSDLFVFGWSLRIAELPSIRFYKLTVSHLF